MKTRSGKGDYAQFCPVSLAVYTSRRREVHESRGAILSKAHYKSNRNHQIYQLLINNKYNTTAHLRSAQSPLRLTINRANRGVVPPHNRETPSCRIIWISVTSMNLSRTLRKQSRLLLYLDEAPILCMRVLTLSKGIVVSALAHIG